MTKSDLYSLTFREFHNKLKGFSELEESRQQIEWERIRWQTFQLAVFHAKKNSLKKPQDLIKFPWEKKKVPRITKEDKERIIKENLKLFGERV